MGQISDLADLAGIHLAHGNVVYCVVTEEVPVCGVVCESKRTHTVDSGRIQKGVAMADEGIPQFFQIELSKKILPGTFADFASIWHTPNVFVMDFVALAQPPQPQDDPETGKPRVLIPGQIVSRIRIPPEQVFEMAKALTQQLEAWEQETGRRPQTPPVFDTTNIQDPPSSGDGPRL